MVDRQAGVEFTAGTDQYTQSLSQAIAITNQYSQAADTMLGRVTKVGGALTTTLIGKTAALTQANKVATAQAAAYQQQLSGLEATSAVLGDRTFPRLEKATKALASTFPVGISQAVVQMQSLQESGVTNLDMVERLAESYTELGAATNSYGPAVGKQMTELTRTMGNSLEMAEGMGDSLTMLTKKYGGTAQGVLAFSKSIAPIASVVGMNQTSVMSLSTAFNRLGEDGYAAGNAINKVLMDIDKSVRTGSPGLRQYANAMNKSVSELREQFQDDPFSVVMDFADAIGKQGPNAIRTMEMLGLEGVRTTKAIASLSREGNLGEIAKTASSSYGGGSASAAASVAMGGVNDQLTKLNETMSQSVAAAGRPFLGLLEGVLKTSNSIASAFNDIVNSGFMQQMGKVGQFGGAAVGAGAKYVSTAMTLGLGMSAARGLGGAGRNFFRGRDSYIMTQAGIPGAMPGGAAARAGSFYAQRRGFTGADAAIIGSANLRGGLAPRVRGAASRLWSDARGGAALAMMSNQNVLESAVGRSRITTPAGGRFMAGMATANLSRVGGDWSKGAKEAGAALKTLEKEVAANGKAFGSLKLRTAALFGASTRVYGKAAGTATLGVTKALTGLGPVGLGVAAAGGAAFAGYKYLKNQGEARESMMDTTDSPYKAFNDFAEKTGYATRNVSLLGEAAEKAAKQILGEENKTEEDAYTISGKERSLARRDSYEPGFATTGNAKVDAENAALLTQSMSPEETSRVVTDVLSQEGEAYAAQFIKGLKESRANAATDRPAWLAKFMRNSDDLNWSGGFLGDVRNVVTAGNYDTTEKKERFGLVGDEIERGRNLDELRGGKRYADVRALETARALYADTAANPDDRDEMVALIEKVIGTTPGAEAKGFILRESLGQEGATFDDLMRKSTDSPLYAAWSNKGPGGPQVEESVGYQQALERDKATKELVGVDLKLADAIYESTIAANALGKEVTALTQSEIADLSAFAQTWVGLQKAPEDPQAINKAGSALAERVLEGVEYSLPKARLALISSLATAEDDGTKAATYEAFNQVQMNPMAQVSAAMMSPMARIREQVQTGATAKRMLASLPENANAETVAALNQQVQGGVSGMSQQVEMARAAAIQVRDALKTMARSQEDFRRSIERAEADFYQQRTWARKDYHHQVFMAERDFNRQMKWGALDYQVSVSRSEDDFFRSRRRSKKDYAISVERAEEAFERSTDRARRDFNKSRRRAEQDYAKQRNRSVDDFYKSRARSTADFYKSRNRAIADYDKALARQIEDSAKTLYDPYTRVMHNQVWDTKQLIANMAEQNTLLGKQMEKVAELKNAGMTQQAVDLLQLSDPGNLQQTMRLSANVAQDPNLIAELNAQAKQRAALSARATTSDDNVGFRRQEEDFALSMKRSSDDFELSMKRSKDDFELSLSRSSTDFATSMSRSTTDYHTSMRRARKDFGISMANSDQDFSKSLKRSYADFTRSMSRSQSDYDKSIRRANKEHDIQMAELERQFGKQLGRQRITFNKSMARSQTDFGIQTGRMMADLNEGMTDITASYDDIIGAAKGRIAKLPKSMRKPLREALGAILEGLEEQIGEFNKGSKPVKIGVEFKDGRTPAKKTGTKNKLNAAQSLLFETQADIDKWNKGKHELEIDINVKDMKVSGTAANKLKRMMAEGVFGGGSDGHEYGEEDGSTRQGGGWLDRAVGYSVSTPRNYGMRTHPISGKRSMHTGVDLGLGSGSPLYAPFNGVAKMSSGSPAWAGNSVVIKPHGGGMGVVYAHMRGFSRGSGSVRKGEKVGAVGSTGTSTGPHLHMEVLKAPYRPYSDAVNPYAFLAKGGIVTKPTMAMFGEAGSHEAAIPLNERGARYMAEVMRRYVSHDEVKTANVAPYSSKVTVNNYTYDSSAQFSGPVTVKAEDPEDFGRKMAAKARRSRLAQPVGSTG